MPVVPRGFLLGAAELAAGSPLTAPRPLGEPAGCADALIVDRASTAAAIDSILFMVSSRALDCFAGSLIAADKALFLLTNDLAQVGATKRLDADSLVIILV
jgi:hypothetical protein